ncbi:MAG TPA: acetolactate synthase [Methanosphaera sp.]|nr:acetolactate synthase [Methanosphaera sp.]HII09207.1 acetolactate synthase [Methanosphaera sp.]HIJ15034.1 acetolactate synthase [Methanosphaera sp.]
MAEKYVDQLSIFLENKEGRLLHILDIIEKLNINIRALSLADTSEFGILRLIVTDPAKVKEELEENDFIVKITKVIAVSISDEPGGLNQVLRILDKNEINLEYLYAFVEQKTYNAIVILKLENNMDEGYKILEEGNVNIISPEEIYSI